MKYAYFDGTVTMQKKRESFRQLNQIRREILELEHAIHVSSVIMDAKDRGESLCPDEVQHELLKLKEDVFNNLRRKHSRQVV